MLRKPIMLLIAIAAAFVLAVTANATPGGRAGATGVVHVTSQGLYYDTFVTNDPLPMRGRFQLLENGQTEFGPGDPVTSVGAGGRTRTQTAFRTRRTTTSTVRSSGRVARRPRTASLETR